MATATSVAASAHASRPNPYLGTIIASSLSLPARGARADRRANPRRRLGATPGIDTTEASRLGLAVRLVNARSNRALQAPAGAPRMGAGTRVSLPLSGRSGKLAPMLRG
jgi:hypothetical protein